MPDLEMQTAEGVVLRLDVAGAGSRFAAGLVDAGILLLVLGITVTGLSMVAGFDPTGLGEFLVGFILAGLFLFVILYHVLFHGFAGGRTPGKMAMRLRVVGADGHPATWLALLLRGLLMSVDFLPVPFPLGALMIALTEKRQRLGDMVGGTIVVRDAEADRRREPFARAKWSALERRELPLTPGLIAKLDADDYALLQEVITRTGLQDQKRRELYRRTAQHYLDRLGLAKPKDARVALKEIYLCAREHRAPKTGANG